MPLPSTLPTRRAILGAAGALGAMLTGSVAHQVWLSTWGKPASITPDVLPEIPVFDARAVGIVAHAEARRESMLALRRACIGDVTPLATPVIAMLDRQARTWLERASPDRIAELDAIARVSGEPGIFLLNASYEFGCTALAGTAPDGQTPRLMRTLDWPFEGLGRHVEIVRQQGEAGEFLNITWPGAVGVLTAMAPGRFAATINQAPFERYSDIDSLQPVDFVRTSLRTWRHVRDIPAMHLLREVFETARTFEEARMMLATRRIARPAIFTLVGIEPGQMAVIERNVDTAHIQNGIATAANDWRYGRFDGRWQGHGGQGSDARGDSVARNARIETYSGHAFPGFEWIEAPILNAFTRLGVEMLPATGELKLQGFEPDANEETALPATALHRSRWT